MKIPFKNSITGEIKEVKIGWSWTLFLFSGIFGLPLFLRKLNVWGFIFLVMWVVYITVPYILPEEEGIITFVLMNLIFIGLQTYLGVKGNEITAKNYLENGWVFMNPESDITKMAKVKWGVYN